ncbi:MAG: hypothetical protein H0X51_03715 [Parachlamydiaceae bacterium]|nr:hypothetical protein [Parachlamydiaceae bacterium]
MRYLTILLVCLGLMGMSKGHAWLDDRGCFRDLQVHFFEPLWVTQALSLHQIFQSQWDPINSKLQDRVRDVPTILKQRANRRGYSSPLENPFQPIAAGELLRQILLEMFTQVLNESNITNQSDIEEMFAYIEQQQRERIKACLGTTKLGK